MRNFKQRLENTSLSLDKLIIDLKENPNRYLHFSIFGKKEKKKAVIFEETRAQLIEQMKRFGQTDIYSKEGMLNIKKEQYEKIREELVREKTNLEYMSDYTA